MKLIKKYHGIKFLINHQSFQFSFTETYKSLRQVCSRQQCGTEEMAASGSTYESYRPTDWPHWLWLRQIWSSWEGIFLCTIKSNYIFALTVCPGRETAGRCFNFCSAWTTCSITHFKGSTFSCPTCLSHIFKAPPVSLNPHVYHTFFRLYHYFSILNQNFKQKSCE